MRKTAFCVRTQVASCGRDTRASRPKCPIASSHCQAFHKTLLREHLRVIQNCSRDYDAATETEQQEYNVALTKLRTERTHAEKMLAQRKSLDATLTMGKPSTNTTHREKGLSQSEDELLRAGVDIIVHEDDKITVRAPAAAGLDAEGRKETYASAEKFLETCLAYYTRERSGGQEVGEQAQESKGKLASGSVLLSGKRTPQEKLPEAPTPAMVDVFKAMMLGGSRKVVDAGRVLSACRGAVGGMSAQQRVPPPCVPLA